MNKLAMYLLFLLVWFKVVSSSNNESNHCHTDGTHFKTLDGIEFKFPVSKNNRKGCNFLLLGSCKNQNIPYFRLLITDGLNNDNNQWKTFAQLHVGGHHIRFYRRFFYMTKVVVDGIMQDSGDYSLSGLNISSDPATKRIVAGFAQDMIRFEYMPTSVSVHVHWDLRDTGLCGLCGNYDGIIYNDLSQESGDPGDWSYGDSSIRGKYFTGCERRNCKAETECAALYDVNVFGECDRQLQLMPLCKERTCCGTCFSRFEIFRQLANECSVFGLPVPGTWVHNAGLHCPYQFVNSSDYGRRRLMKTLVGNIGSTELNCFSTGEPYGTSFCNADVIKGPNWGEITWLPACPSAVESNQTKELEVLSLQDVSPKTCENVSLALKRLTEPAGHLTNKDVVLTSMILKNIAEVSKVNIGAAQSVVIGVNNIMRTNKRSLSAAQNKNRALNRAVASLEVISNRINLENRQSAFFDQPNLAVESRKLKDMSSDVAFGINPTTGVLSNSSNSNRSNLNHNTTSTSIVIPTAVLKQIFQNKQDLDGEKIGFTIYKDVSLFTKPENTKSTKQNAKLASYVIAASIAGVPVNNLTTQVQITFEPTQDTDSYACVYWDLTLNDHYGGWSQTGCYSSGRQGSHVICLCNHLTHFAILFDTMPDVSPPFALQVLSKIGLALSTFGLSVTIASFLLFRRFRKGRGFRILFQLCVSLLAVNVLVLVGIERTDLPEVCMSLAALLLYFLLAAFCWMMVEAVHQYLLFVKVYGSDITAFMRKAALFAWGFPAVIIAVVSAIDVNMFRGPESFCWINRTALFYAFMLPVGTIILVNTVLFSLVVRGIFCARVKQEYRGKRGSHADNTLQLMIAVACFIVTGLTWVFGFFAVGDARVTFQYLFCIFNSMQGFCIFLFYVVREKRLRHAWITFLCCREDSKEATRHQLIMTSSSIVKSSSG